ELHDADAEIADAGLDRQRLQLPPNDVRFMRAGESGWDIFLSRRPSGPPRLRFSRFRTHRSPPPWVDRISPRTLFTRIWLTIG
ncbi:MAG: hypothetical protein K8F57_00270, partial [Alphaproteobacteria bacterium]|nr:hypothetical protein [Alphaproteobacteria bacterium]